MSLLMSSGLDLLYADLLLDLAVIHAPLPQEADGVAVTWIRGHGFEVTAPAAGSPAPDAVPAAPLITDQDVPARVTAIHRGGRAPSPRPAVTAVPEVNRVWRGHDFVPPEDERRRIPGQDEARRGRPAERLIAVHYFSPAGDWWITSMWHDEGQWMAYGYAQLASYPDGAEWGDISLTELEHVRVARGIIQVLIERDLHWTPVPFWRTTAHGMWGDRARLLDGEAAAAAALADLPRWARRHGLTPESTRAARAMVLGLFPAAAALREPPGPEPGR